MPFRDRRFKRGKWVNTSDVIAQDLKKQAMKMFHHELDCYCPVCGENKFLVPSNPSAELICCNCEWEGYRPACEWEGYMKNKDNNCALRKPFIEEIKPARIKWYKNGSFSDWEDINI